MPAFNEENIINDTIEIVAQWQKNSIIKDFELIIVDDGSTDKTEAIILDKEKEYNWLRHIYIKNQGMMNAIINGIKIANYENIGTLEADSPVSPKYFDDFIKYIDKYDVIIGSRFLAHEIVGKSFYRRTISYCYFKLFTLLFRTGISDAQISFRLYKRNCILNIIEKVCLRHDGLKSTEIVVKAIGMGYNCKEFPVTYNHRDDSKAVPKGIKSVKPILQAFFALLQLWLQISREYKNGELDNKCTRFI